MCLPPESHEDRFLRTVGRLSRECILKVIMRGTILVLWIAFTSNMMPNAVPRLVSSTPLTSRYMWSCVRESPRTGIYLLIPLLHTAFSVPGSVL